MEVTKGKLKNVKSGKDLVFALNPTQYELNQRNDFDLEPQLGQNHPLVAFRCGGATVLNFSLCFDRDAGVAEEGIQGVRTFLQEAGKIDSETIAPSPLQFKMGGFEFQGFLRSYRLIATRFDPKGEVLSCRLDAELLSDGSFEEGGKS